MHQVPSLPEGTRNTPLSRVSFSGFEADFQARELRKNGRRIRLQGKPFQLLEYLTRHPGKAVDRETLRHVLWPTDTFVDFNANLKAAVNKLRRTLGDSAESATFIETVPGVGYRFVATVSPAVAEIPQAAMAEEERSEHRRQIARVQATSDRRSLSQRLAWATVIALAVGGISGLLANRALRTASANRPERRPVFLVLPFSNLSGDPAQEFVSDGMTDELITLLGRQYSDQAEVIARTSAMKYKGTSKSFAELSRELGGVDFYIEGSVRRSGGKLAVNAQLFRASDRKTLWAGTYEGSSGELLGIQRDMASHVSQSVLAGLSPAIGNAHPGASHPVAAAYEEYLRGRFEENKRTRAGSAKSIALYRSSIEKDPNYAPAHAALAYAHLVSAGWQFTRPLESYSGAEAEAQRALELDPNLSEAHVAMAVVEHEYHWSWQEAERHFLRALELDPNSPIAHKSYAEFLMHAGRFKDAVAQIQYARDLDPVSLPSNAMVGFIYLHSGDIRRAKEECQHVLAMDPNYAPAHYFLGAAYNREGQFEKAIAEYKLSSTLSDNELMVEPSLAAATYQLGRRAEARQMAERLVSRSRKEYVPALALAVAWLRMGEKEKGLAWLEKASRDHEAPILFLKVDHIIDRYLDDPRFLEIFRRVGFPAS